MTTGDIGYIEAANQDPMLGAMLWAQSMGGANINFYVPNCKPLVLISGLDKHFDFNREHFLMYFICQHFGILKQRCLSFNMPTNQFAFTWRFMFVVFSQ
jgi:hypothetical protein